MKSHVHARGVARVRGLCHVAWHHVAQMAGFGKKVWGVASALPLAYLVQQEAVGLHRVRDNTMAPLLESAPDGSARSSDVVLVRKGLSMSGWPAKPGDVVLFRSVHSQAGLCA